MRIKIHASQGDHEDEIILLVLILVHGTQKCLIDGRDYCTVIFLIKSFLLKVLHVSSFPSTSPSPLNPSSHPYSSALPRPAPPYCLYLQVPCLHKSSLVDLFSPTHLPSPFPLRFTVLCFYVSGPVLSISLFYSTYE